MDRNENSGPQNPADEAQAYRKLIRSFILVLILMGCATLLLLLGQCTSRSDRREEGRSAPTFGAPISLRG